MNLSSWLSTLAVDDGENDAEDPPRRKCDEECIVWFVLWWIPPQRKHAQQELANGIRNVRAEEAQFVVSSGQQLQGTYA